VPDNKADAVPCERLQKMSWQLHSHIVLWRSMALSKTLHQAVCVVYFALKVDTVDGVNIFNELFGGR
jgi:hypothetical protein